MQETGLTVTAHCHGYLIEVFMRNNKAIVTQPLRCIRRRNGGVVFEGQILMVEMQYENGDYIGPILRYDFVKVLKITRKSTFSSVSADVHCKVLHAHNLPKDHIYLNEYIMPMQDLIAKGYTLRPGVWRLLKCLHG